MTKTSQLQFNFNRIGRGGAFDGWYFGPRMTSDSSGNCASSDAESSDAADSTGSHPSAK
jgi:hypothetical protein